MVEGLPTVRHGGVKAWVNVTYGCNNFCSYCIVPYVRGRERSRQPGDILAEIAGLATNGYQEVTLLGQNVNSYGKDLAGKTDFAGLLQRVDQETGLARIRFMTSHPRDFTEELVRVIAAGKNICEHIHLPVQSGSNRLLELMNRGYSREHYLDLVAMLRRHLPGCALTTDLIVGFPGETEADFQETLALVEQVGFDSAFTFLYSLRQGTPAASMPGQVFAAVKKERFARLLAVQNRWSLERNAALVGQAVEVLLEGPSKTDQGVLTGRTRTGKTVNFTGSYAAAGTFVTVEISEARTWSLVGRQAL